MTKNYDVIVSDYQMPDMDGIELLKHLRASGNDIPFIIFTGRSHEQAVIEALNNGADFYLQKGNEPKIQFVEPEDMIIQATARKRAANLSGSHPEALRYYQFPPRRDAGNRPGW